MRSCGRDSRIPSSVRSSGRKGRGDGRSPAADGHGCSHAITMVDLHDAVWVAMAHAKG